MRRAVLVLLTLTTALLGAQDRPSAPRPNLVESPYYTKNVFINRLISTEAGYRVEYLNARMEPVATYIPIEWFSRTNEMGRTEDGGTKAELLFGNDAAYPYMSIFWKNGKFSHVRIYARQSYGDPSWGVLPRGLDISDRFKPDQDPVFRF